MMDCDIVLKSGLQESPSDVQARQAFIDLIIGSYLGWEGEYDKAINRYEGLIYPLRGRLK